MGQARTAVETRRWGSGTAGIVRLLIAADTPLVQSAIADMASVSQPRVSQVVAMLADLEAIRSMGTGYFGKRARLLDLYARRTRPVLSGSERHLYSTRPQREQATRILRTARRHGVRVAFSADLAVDLLVPWRHPTLTAVYAQESFPIEEAGLVVAEGRADASIILRITSDQTLLTASGPWPSAMGGMPLADPVQQWWDLLDLGGEDRAEAAARLRRAILDRSIVSS
jgi:hypothetical protein